MTDPTATTRVDLNTESVVFAAEISRLARFLRVNLVGLATCIVAMVVLAVIIESGRMWVIIGCLAALALIVGLAERLIARRANPGPGLTLFAVAIWLYALGTTALAPFLLPVNLLVLLLPIIFPVVLLSRRQAVRLLIGTGLTGYAVLAISMFLPDRLAALPPRWAEIVIVGGVTAAIMTVNIYGLSIVFDRSSQYNALLRESRARIVAVALETRRRIERDLHDGAQQRLVSTSVRLSLAGRQLESDPTHAADTLREAAADLRQALEDLRELAHGIYPPLLVQRGLGPALRAATHRSPFPVEVDVPDEQRLATDLEATVYFCCLEALQNVAKHAAAGQVSIRIRVGSTLEFTVHDDGVGFDPEAVTDRSGLINMADRMAALDGSLDIESAPGRGTTVHGRVPISRVPISA